MPASRLWRLRSLLRRTAPRGSLDRLNEIPQRPANAMPRPAPAMVMAPDKSRFQRHSAHLRTRIIGAESAAADTGVEDHEELAEDSNLPGEAKSKDSADARDPLGSHADDGEEGAADARPSAD